MAIQRQLVDTNVLARFFTGEPSEMAAKARRLVERADRGEVRAPDWCALSQGFMGAAIGIHPL